MSTFTVRIEVQVNGPITSDGMPQALSWEHEHNTGDNPRFYPVELAKALKTVHRQAIDTTVKLGFERATAALGAAFPPKEEAK